MQQWRLVDEGWGRAAADFATLSEPANCREYVALHHQLKVDDGDRLLDVACGSGLAIELATLRGAACAGIDASPRLVAIARDRSPDADIRVGDMHALPWERGIVRRRHELPRGVGHHARRGHRDPPRPRARRSPRPHRLGPHQGLARRVGPVPVPAGRPARCREPGRDGRAGQAGRGRGAAGRSRLRRHPPTRHPVRMGVRRPADLRADPGLDSAPPTKPSGPSANRPSTTRPCASPPNRSATACRCAPRSPSPATSRAKAKAKSARELACCLRSRRPMRAAPGGAKAPGWSRRCSW